MQDNQRRIHVAAFFGAACLSVLIALCPNAAANLSR